MIPQTINLLPLLALLAVQSPSLASAQASDTSPHLTHIITGTVNIGPPLDPIPIPGGARSSECGLGTSLVSLKSTLRANHKRSV